ncbi:MAG: phosphatidate cytidylyltransferase [Janthinobacterium lividum]
MKRIFTAIVLIALVGALIYLDKPWLITVFSAVVSLLAALEFRGLAAKAEMDLPFWWTAAAIALLFTVTALRPFEGLTAVTFATFVLFLWASFRSALTRVLPGTAAGSFLLLYVAYPLSLLPRILALEEGTALLLFLFLCVWCGDIAALYVGKSIGRHKLAPSLSPNKTWEGAIASVLGSVAFGMGLILLGNRLAARNAGFSRLSTREPWWHFLLLAILLNIAAQLGDLVESALKRGVDVKDSGTLLPGHGGMLDRIDALLFAAPVLWFVVVLREAF